jgi:hypothetical protein
MYPTIVSADIDPHNVSIEEIEEIEEKYNGEEVQVEEDRMFFGSKY